ncbi:hypothetical protein CS542_02310 [Pedobacter sp. IW39]|nr:hypothetical protein CS542_02310 [Pedobacter sp. IW39]
MLSVLYRVEEYLQQENLKAEEIYTIEYFVGEFCKVLGLNKSQFTIIWILIFLILINTKDNAHLI